MLIYIAGPMNRPNRVHNLRHAIDAAERITMRGHAVHIPHLKEIWDLIYKHENEFWMRMDFAIIKKCDGLIRLRGESPGADREVSLARGLDIPIFGDGLNDGVEEFMNSKYWCQTEPF